MKGLLSKDIVRTGATALGGMVVGAIVGIAVQVGVEATGILGPSVDALLAEQQTGFDEVNARLDDLRRSTDDPALEKELVALSQLLQQQDELRRKAGSELTLLSNELAALRSQSLEKRGFAGGADVWLGVGESISVGDNNSVFGVNRMWKTAVDVNLNGKKSRLNVGDSISTDKCNVFFRQAMREDDSRAGFDIVCR